MNVIPRTAPQALWTTAKTLVGRNLQATVTAEVTATGLRPGPVDPSTVTDADLDALPPTAQRYLRYMGAVGRPRDWSFSAHFTGRFRMRPNLPWMPCASWQYNTASPITRTFHMRIDFAGFVPLVGRDIYREGHGLMHGKLLDLVTVVRGEGDEFDTGELTTFLNDGILLAPSMLLTPAARWTAVDDDHFDIALTDAGRTVTARVLVDEQGAPVDFESSDRYATLPEGLTRARWSTPTTGWRVIGDRPQPGQGSAIWHLDSGPYEYGQLRLEPGDVRHNVVPGARTHDQRHSAAAPSPA